MGNNTLATKSEKFKYFAGCQFIGEQTSGGTGSTIESAVEDYFNKCAEYEIINYACLDDGNEFTVDIYSTFASKEDWKKSSGSPSDIECDEYWDENWDFILNELIEKRTFRIERIAGEVEFLRMS